ncbi:GntR family transcriptional regulator [Vibrio sp. Vb339]|uniref:GntR family transcriptional regulator n=1 Tax=Vibrio sp. Vb339 TaxID=1192013 RepID=UPI0015540E60|nr:GntR family transcriptional regulator [Vibrio sp. Vb339]
MKKQSLSKVVEQQLEQMILSGQLLPGERINESYLSNALDISRAPIREACRQLAQYGMVEVRTGKGTYVRQVELSEAIELYEIRGVFDAFAAEQTALRASDNEIKDLSVLVEKMKACVKDDDTSEYFALNLQFHHQIVLLSGNQSLIGQYELVLRKLSLFRQKTLSKPDRLVHSLSHHENIMLAIQRRDSLEAAKLARSHVEDAKGVLKKSQS